MFSLEFRLETAKLIVDQGYTHDEAAKALVFPIIEQRLSMTDHGKVQYESKTHEWQNFTQIKASTHNDMVELVHIISQRIARYLENVSIVERDVENSFINLPVDDEINPDE